MRSLPILFIGEIVFGSRGIKIYPVPIPTGKSTEPTKKCLRDGARAILWVTTGHTGASPGWLTKVWNRRHKSNAHKEYRRWSNPWDTKYLGLPYSPQTLPLLLDNPVHYIVNQRQYSTKKMSLFITGSGFGFTEVPPWREELRAIGSQRALTFEEMERDFYQKTPGKLS